MPIATAAVLTCVQPAQAQPIGSQEDERHRNNCRLAAQVLEAGHPATRDEWAWGYIRACSDEGPAALVRLWDSAGADSAEARYLITNSAELRDARLYDQLRRIVTDRARPDVIRVAAMLVLVRYANPENAIVLSDVTPPHDSIGRTPLLGRWSSGTYYMPGSTPLPPSVAPTILELLVGTAETPSNSRAVEYAALVLARRVRLDIESGDAQ